MPEFNRTATSTWSGDLKKGNGKVSTQSNTLDDASVTFVSRFEHGKGTNPEELIAAAHAACFSMALANGLSEQGHPPDSIQTQATVTLVMGDQIKITKIHLETEGKVPGIDDATFQQAAEDTKKNCPVSVLLLPGLEEATLSATLAQ